MKLDMLDCWVFFFFWLIFLLGYSCFFVFPGLEFWAVANNGGGVGGGSLVRL